MDLSTNNPMMLIKIQSEEVSKIHNIIATDLFASDKLFGGLGASKAGILS